MSDEKYFIAPKLVTVDVSIESGFLIIKPLLYIPVGYVWFENKLALCFCTISFTSKLVSKLSPSKNCWVL